MRARIGRAAAGPTAPRRTFAGGIKNKIFFSAASGTEDFSEDLPVKLAARESVLFKKKKFFPPHPKLLSMGKSSAERR